MFYRVSLKESQKNEPQGIRRSDNSKYRKQFKHHKSRSGKKFIRKKGKERDKRKTLGTLNIGPSGLPYTVQESKTSEKKYIYIYKRRRV